MVQWLINYLNKTHTIMPTLVTMLLDFTKIFPFVYTSPYIAIRTCKMVLQMPASKSLTKLCHLLSSKFKKMTFW
ncbi:hypothetical protein XELAEV_18031062mg [Xenopus laevis]|uniref:Uncharacterized protein n=1 Tax=Xenopus laevis TaxID=8355 RepID=A0A974CLZ9_XENLA|nr:hypothetical protein XELAEV_18031062mg [Xenopus laevis]